MKTRYMIGIDPGTKTGFAVWDREEKKFVKVETRGIVSAMHQVKFLLGDEVVIRIEDARQRKWFGKTDRERLQGVGSVKRDSSIWEEFCDYYSIEYMLIAPKNNRTKTTAAEFKKMTGWEGRTSEHSRDAAMLVWGA